ncbi:hypothetical protein, partial [Cellulomonas bogoriensis]|uniref:hypothetical protein n=1 Tax=Cellulomonas bogoriensis TaxID=301388 RepID=UPI000555452D
MDRAQLSHRWLVLAAAIAVVGALGVALARSGAVLLHQCVSGEGLVGTLGVRLALLHADSACPTGTLALGVDGRQVAGIVVIVALPVLLAHVGALALGLGALGRLGALARRVAGVLRWVPIADPEPLP